MANENETVEQVCAEMTSCHSPEVYCEDVRNYGYRVSAAHKRELAAKDALIKELADALDNYPCHNCKHGSDRCEWCDRMKEFDTLVAKAREVVK